MNCFLYDVEIDYKLDNEVLSLDEAITKFYELSDVSGSFFGVRTDKNEILQFTWENKDKWLIDVPYDVEKRLFLQKYSNYDECVEIIKSVYFGLKPKNIKGLEKVSI